MSLASRLRFDDIVTNTIKSSIGTPASIRDIAEYILEMIKKNVLKISDRFFLYTGEFKLWREHDVKVIVNEFETIFEELFHNIWKLESKNIRELINIVLGEKIRNVQSDPVDIFNSTDCPTIPIGTLIFEEHISESYEIRHRKKQDLFTYYFSYNLSDNSEILKTTTILSQIFSTAGLTRLRRELRLFLTNDSTTRKEFTIGVGHLAESMHKLLSESIKGWDPIHYIVSPGVDAREEVEDTKKILVLTDHYELFATPKLSSGDVVRIWGLRFFRKQE